MCRRLGLVFGLIRWYPDPLTLEPALVTGTFTWSTGRGRTDGGKERLTGVGHEQEVEAFGLHREGKARRREGRRARARAARPLLRRHPGWLARVQSLAKVVAEEGTIEIAIFAKAPPRSGVGNQ